MPVLPSPPRHHSSSSRGKTLSSITLDTTVPITESASTSKSSIGSKRRRSQDVSLIAANGWILKNTHQLPEDSPGASVDEENRTQNNKAENAQPRSKSVRHPPFPANPPPLLNSRELTKVASNESVETAGSSKPAPLVASLSHPSQKSMQISSSERNQVVAVPENNFTEPSSSSSSTSSHPSTRDVFEFYGFDCRRVTDDIANCVEKHMFRGIEKFEALMRERFPEIPPAKMDKHLKIFRSKLSRNADVWWDDFEYYFMGLITNLPPGLPEFQAKQRAEEVRLKKKLEDTESEIISLRKRHAAAAAALAREEERKRILDGYEKRLNEIERIFAQHGASWADIKPNIEGAQKLTELIKELIGWRRVITAMLQKYAPGSVETVYSQFNKVTVVNEDEDEDEMEISASGREENKENRENSSTSSALAKENDARDAAGMATKNNAMKES